MHGNIPPVVFKPAAPPPHDAEVPAVDGCPRVPKQKVWGVLEVVQLSVLWLGWEGYQGLRARQYPHHSLPGDGA